MTTVGVKRGVQGYIYNLKNVTCAFLYPKFSKRSINSQRRLKWETRGKKNFQSYLVLVIPLGTHFLWRREHFSI